MYLHNCPSKSAKVTPAKKKEAAAGIRETHFTGGKATLILTTGVKVIHAFYT